MITLPAGWSAYIEGSFQNGYLIRITTQDSTVYRWGTIDTDDIGSWTGDRYYGNRLALDGLGIISNKADIRKGGNLGVRGDFEFDILNQDGYYNSELVNHELSNAKVEIFLVMLEVSPADESDCLKRYVYTISDYDIDKETVHITCTVDENEHTAIPRTMIDEKEFATFTIPDNSKGKPVPLCFGEIEKAEAVFANVDETIEDGPDVCTAGSDNTLTDSDKSWTINEHTDKDLEIIGGEGKGQIFPIASNSATVLTIKDQFQTNPVANDSVYQISGKRFDLLLHDGEIKSFVLGDDGQKQAWFWDDTLKIYRKMNPRILSFYTSAVSYGLRAGIRYYSGVIKNPFIQFYFPYPFTHTRDPIGLVFSNPENCIDFDNTTYASGTTTGLGANLPLIEGRFATNLKEIIGDWDKIYVYLVGNHNYGAGSETIAYCEVYGDAGNAIGAASPWSYNPSSDYVNNIMTTLYTPPSGYPSGANCKMFDVSALVNAGDWAAINYNLWFRVFITGHEPGVKDYDIRLYDIGLILMKSIELNEQTRFFAHLQGRMFDDTWGSRKTSANMIENPADVIEKVLRDDLGVAGSDIDTADFDTVSGTDRSGWKLAYQIKNEIESLDEIKKICEEVFCIYFKDHEGKHTLKALKTSGSAARTLTLDDVLTEEDDERTLLFDWELSPLDGVYNEFHVHYDKDPATGEYHGHAFVKNPSAGSYNSDYVSTMHSGSDLYGNESTYWGYCHTSCGKYGFVRTRHIYLDRIRDDVTAENILAIAIKWFYLRKAEVFLKTQLQNVDLEIGDLIGLSDQLRAGTYFLNGIDADCNLDEIGLWMREV